MGFLKKPSRYAPFSDQSIFGLGAAYWECGSPEMVGSPEASLHYSMLGTQFETALSPMAAFRNS
jgi:hypothetical protein